MQRRFLSKPRGLLIPDDAGMVSHVSFPGGVLDRRGNAWTLNGSPTFTARQGKTPPGISGLSDAAYLSLGTGNDALDFAGDFSACFVFSWPGNSVVATVFTNGKNDATGVGYYLTTVSATQIIFDTNAAGSAFVRSLAAGLVAGLNVVCFGRSGTTQYLKVNLGSIVSSPNSYQNAGTSCVAKIGRGETTTQGFPGTIYEGMWSSTAIADAWATAVAQRVKARAGISAW